MHPELLELINSRRAPILEEWQSNLRSTGWDSGSRFGAGEMAVQSAEFLALMGGMPASGNLESAEAAPIRNFLDALSRSLAITGATSSQTATFVFSLKKPLFNQLRENFAGTPEQLADATWSISELMDKLGLHTVATYQKSREEVISRQQEEMLELSTPVVKLWEGVLALPMIGTLDSARTHVVMESLLQRIVETGSTTAIIDITGVPTVDTLVAQHLLKTVTAIRLMGADCIISGIRPQIAQTIVHLGIDLQGITTKATLADALMVALRRGGFTVSRPN